jgi:hypothetical protein
MDIPGEKSFCGPSKVIPPLLLPQLLVGENFNSFHSATFSNSGEPLKLSCTKFIKKFINGLE